MATIELESIVQAGLYGGQYVRRLRTMARFGLRELAKRVGISPSYLSDIENDRRVPAEDVLADLARELGVSRDSMMLTFGRISGEVVQYLQRRPIAHAVLQAMVELDLSDREVLILVSKLRQKAAAKGGGE